MEKKDNENSYINKIFFNSKDFKEIVLSYFGNVRFAIMLIIIIAGAGITSYITLPRTLSPEVKIPIVSVFTVLPGAGPDDVESLVTEPLEDEIRSLPKIDIISSSSREGVSSIMIQFLSDVDPDKAKQDVQSAVDSVRVLPSEATTPNVDKLDFENQPIWMLSITSKADEVSLNQFSKQLKENLENLSLIDRVSVNGLEEKEIQVLIKDEIITQYGIDARRLLGIIQAEVSSYPAGAVNSSQSSFSLTIDSGITSIEDIRNININLDQQRYRLSDIATITERSKPDQFAAFLASPNSPKERSVSFNVYKTSSANINDAQKEASELVETEIRNQEDHFQLIDVLSTANELEIQFSDLFSSFRNTILLVFLVLLIFFGLRQAIIASLTIPLTFLAAFVVMDITGISLNFLSSFSLLLSLGLLVDVTIVIISAITSFYRSGRFTPYEAGLLVWKDYLVALWTTTLTTVWAFIPLLLASGIIGEFIKPIPIVVSSVLISATLVGFFVTIPMMIAILKPNIPNRVRIFFWSSSAMIGALIVYFLVKGSILIIPALVLYVLFIWISYTLYLPVKDSLKIFLNNNKAINNIKSKLSRYTDDGLVSMQKVSGYYGRLLKNIISSKISRRKTVFMVVIFSFFAFALLPLGFVVNEFFPKEDTNEIYVDIEFIEGTKKEIVQEKSLDILEELKNTSFAETTVLQLGVGYSSEAGPGGVSGPNRALFTINLSDKNERKTDSISISQEIRDKYQNYPDGKVSVNILSGGPPAGSDVQIAYLGDDLSVLDELANKTITYLESQNGTINIDKSVKSGTAKIVFIPEKEKIADAGISISDIGISLRVFASGFELDSDINLQNGDREKYDIILRTSSNIQELESLGKINISTSKGDIPLSALGKFELAYNPTVINREDGKRIISVSAGTQEGFSASKINADLVKFADEELDLPEGFTWKTGGANEENEKSVQSILQAMVLSFLLILSTMVIQFGSFRKALIVLLVIPLAVSGVFIVFALTGVPLSFPALIGVLALFGIVVNNSIILIDKIRLNEKTGMDLDEAIVEASSSRLEPIALSSITTIVGLVPITLSNPLWQGLGGAIISGLIFSGTIMLFFIPVVYRMWFGEKEIS